VSVGDVVDRHRLVVCVGTGGVGKTTVAASLALGAALRGRRAMVLTIDPARQLARALGLASLAHGGERVQDELLAAAGLGPPRGSLHAAMLDQKSAWDGFVTRHARDEATRERILANPFYRQLSTSFAGSAEYVAVEELCRLHESGDHDLVVLDTPPTGGALDFLRAPERIDRLLLDPETARWLARPVGELTRGARRAASRAAGLIVRRLEKATGSRTLEDVSALFQALRSLSDDIARRTTQARALLRGPDTAFVLVTAPGEHVLAETDLLRAEIDELEAPIRAVLLNRAHPLPHDEPPGDALQTLLDGLRTSADASADVLGWIEGTYRDGKPDGTFRAWDASGQLVGEIELKRGTGTWIKWHANGTVEVRGQLIEGRKAGTWTHFSPDGEVVKEEAFDSRGTDDGAASSGAPDAKPSFTAPDALSVS